MQRFGGEEKLKIFIVKMVESVNQDSSFTELRLKIQNDLELKELLNRESLLNLAKEMFNCENLNEIEKQKDFLRKLCLSDE